MLGKIRNPKTSMNRLKIFFSLIFNLKFWGILSSVYGFLSLIRDEFLPLDMAEQYRLGGMLGTIDWYWWVIFGLVIWTISVAWVSSQNSGNKKNQINTEIEILNFTQLAQAIWEPLSKNGKTFLSFGPNSGASSAAPVRWDLKIWEEAKKDIIVPNNRIIKLLIEKNFHLIPNEYRSVFEQMIAHIYAFEKHVENPELDYRDHRFPDEFARVIDDVCVNNTKHQAILAKIENWIVKKIDDMDIPMIAGFIGGSVLRGFYNNADVDIFILLSDNAPEEIKLSGRKLDSFKKDFLNKFGKKVHVVAFSLAEEKGFYEFVESLKQKKKIR